MPTYTDTERLEFLAVHGAWLSWSRDQECVNVWHRDDDTSQPEPFQGYPQKVYDDYRKAIDACMDEWNARLAEIAGGRLHPSKEVRRFADASNPRGQR